MDESETVGVRVWVSGSRVAVFVETVSSKDVYILKQVCRVILREHNKGVAGSRISRRRPTRTEYLRYWDEFAYVHRVRFFLGDLFRFVRENVENAGCRNRSKIRNSVVCRPIRVGFEVSERGRRAECGRDE